MDFSFKWLCCFWGTLVFEICPPVLNSFHVVNVVLFLCWIPIAVCWIFCALNYRIAISGNLPRIFSQHIWILKNTILENIMIHWFPYKKKIVCVRVFFLFFSGGQYFQKGLKSGSFIYFIYFILKRGLYILALIMDIRDREICFFNKFIYFLSTGSLIQ